MDPANVRKLVPQRANFHKSKDFISRVEIALVPTRANPSSCRWFIGVSRRRHAKDSRITILKKRFQVFVRHSDRQPKTAGVPYIRTQEKTREPLTRFEQIRVVDIPQFMILVCKFLKSGIELGTLSTIVLERHKPRSRNLVEFRNKNGLGPLFWSNQGPPAG